MTLVNHLIRLLLWLCAIACVSQSAVAFAGPSIAVLAPEIEGEWRGLNSDAATQAVAKGLEGIEGFEVQTAGAQACTDAPCWTHHARELGVTHLLRTRLTIVDQDADVRLEVFDGRGGALVASSESSCEVCADNEVREMLTATTARLRPRLEALFDRSSTLVVDARPKGADVIVDGEVVGQTPFRGTVTPGTHAIVVAAPGYHSHQAEEYAEPGGTKVIEVDLEARAVEKEKNARLRPIGYVGIAAIGAGVALVGSGIGLLVIDGDPVKSTCPDGMRDSNGRCPRMYDTRVPAILTLATGGAAMVTGAVLLILDRKRPKRVEVGVGPRAISIRGRF